MTQQTGGVKVATAGADCRHAAEPWWRARLSAQRPASAPNAAGAVLTRVRVPAAPKPLHPGTPTVRRTTVSTPMNSMNSMMRGKPATPATDEETPPTASDLLDGIQAQLKALRALVEATDG